MPRRMHFHTPSSGSNKGKSAKQHRGHDFDRDKLLSIIRYGILYKRHGIQIKDIVGAKSIRIIRWDNTKLFPYLDMEGVPPFTLQYIPCKISDVTWTFG